MTFTRLMLSSIDEAYWTLLKINSYVDATADSIGLSEPAFRFLVALLLEFPLVIVLRLVFMRPSVNKAIRNLYIAASGLFNGWFFCNFSAAIVPAIAATVLTWSSLFFFCNVLKINRHAVATLVWIGNCSYLMYCYFHFASLTYDINWLTPQSVLCLRLLSLTTDFSDGASEKSTDRALKRLPGLMQTVGYCFFTGSFLVGPQLPYKKYDQFISLELFADHGHRIPPGSIKYCFNRVLLGVMYFAVQLVGDKYVAMSEMTKPWFARVPLYQRLGYMWLAGKMFLNKYLGVWVMNEGACAITGISYGGRDPSTKKAVWSGLANVLPSVYEFPTCLGDIIGSFNINTSGWSKVYIYKRLRFLGNKHLSSLGALCFLCFWHGFHIGYPVTFAMEFFLMIIENKLSVILGPYLSLLYKQEFKDSNFLVKLLRIVKRVCSYVLTTLFLHYAVVAFAVLHWDTFNIVYSRLLYFGHVAIGIGLLFVVIVPVRKQKENKTE